MSTYHGKVSTFKIDDTGGTERDLSDFVTDYSLDMQKDTGETTGKGSDAKTFAAGHYGSTISVSGRWDDTLTTGPHVVMMGLIQSDSAVDFRLGFGGDTTGRQILTGQAIVTAYTPSSPLAGIVDFSATLQCTGVITPATAT